jgi:O-antigen/teichoic acid export membrane protein
MAEPAQAASVGAARGVGILVGRTISLQFLTAGVTVVLARLLSPADYGLFAIAAAIEGLAQSLTGVGLTAALIRQPHDPSPAQQVAARSFLLLTGSGFSLLALLLGFALLPALGIASEAVKVTAIASLAVPVHALRTVPMTLLERHLSFGRVAIVETGETLAFNAFALLAAIAGLGAYSLAGAIPAAGLVGAIAAWRVQRTAPGFSLSFAELRSLAGFGTRVSLFRMLALGRELGFVALITAIGGTALAGFYTMATRLFSFPIALASAVQRVTFPALSRAPRERGQRAARGAVLAAMLAGLPLALVAGASHTIVTVLLGERWLPTVDVVLIGAAGMLLAASAIPAMISLAFADGEPGAAIAAVLGSALALGLASALAIGPLDSAGVGLAMLASALTSTAVLAGRTESPLRRALLPIGRGIAIGVLAAAAGYLLPAGDGWGALVARVAVTALAWVALQTALAREELRDAVSLSRAVLATRRAEQRAEP